MCNKLDWYFCKKFFLSSLLTGSLFFTLFFLINLLENLDEALTFNILLLGTALETIQVLNKFLISILFMSFLFAFGSMAQNREVIVMQALGFSYQRLVTMILKGSLIILTLWFVSIELALPWSSTKSKRLFSEKKINTNFSKKGEWIRSNEFLVRVITGNKDNLFGITAYQFDHVPKVNLIYKARKGYWKDNQLILHNVQTTEYIYNKEFKDTNVIKQSKKIVALNLDINYNTFSSILLETKQMYLPELLNYASYIVKNKLDGGNEKEFIFAFWNRISIPLGVLGLILLFLPTMLGTPRVQKIGNRIFYGILVGTVYYIMEEAIKHGGYYLEVPIPLTATLLPLSLFFLGIIVSYRSL